MGDLKQQLFSGDKVSKTYSLPVGMIAAISEFAYQNKILKSAALQEIILYGLIYAKTLEGDKSG